MMDDVNACLAADTNQSLVQKTGFAISLFLDMRKDLHMEPK